MGAPTKQYVVFHDYGTEGWQVTAQCDTKLEAVQAREADIANGGGTAIIAEVMDLLEFYGSAGYELRDQRRKAEAAAKV